MPRLTGTELGKLSSPRKMLNSNNDEMRSQSTCNFRRSNVLNQSMDITRTPASKKSSALNAVGSNIVSTGRMTAMSLNKTSNVDYGILGQGYDQSGAKKRAQYGSIGVRDMIATTA